MTSYIMYTDQMCLFRFSVRVGEWLTNSDIDCGEEFCGLPVQDIAISHVIVHPGYEKQSYKNNIALLVLSRKLNYTGKVKYVVDTVLQT